MTPTYEDLQHLDHRARLHAVARVAEQVQDTQRLLDLLLPRLRDTYPAVREDAALALGQRAIDDPQVLATLVQHSGPVAPDDPYGLWVRLAALFGLGRAGRGAARLEAPRWDAARMVALEALGADEPDVRFQALAALDRLGASAAQAQQAVRGCIDDEDDEVSASAAGMLATWRDTQSIAALQGRWDTLRDAQARRDVAHALARLVVAAPDNAPQALRERLIDALLADVRRLPHALPACELLGALGAQRAAPVLGKLVRGWLTNRFIRVAAAAGLARMGHKEGSQALGRFLTARRREQRGFAIEQIGQLKLEAFTSELIAIMKNTADEHAPVATVALGKMGSEAALEALRGAVDDARKDVRFEARAALGLEEGASKG